MEISFAVTLWDLIVMAIAYIYVIIVISLGEVLRKKLNYDLTFTRKVIHLFAGFSAYTVPYYDHPWIAIIVALTFVILLWVSSPKCPIKKLRDWFSVMADRESELEAGHILGPVYYSISITVLVAIFTLVEGLLPYIYIPMMALTTMFWGDGLGAPVGKKYGKHKYKTIGGTRSLEGSLAVFIGSFVGALFAAWFFGILNFHVLSDMWKILLLSLIAAITTTIVEAVSPSGYDNFSVPFIGTLVLWFAAAVL